MKIKIIVALCISILSLSFFDSNFCDDPTLPAPTENIIFASEFFPPLVFHGYHFEKIIFFGDSRFELMADDTPEPENFVALYGACYDWTESQLDTVKSMYTEGSVILFEFGVNDAWNAEAYIEVANQLAAEGYNVAYLTLLPVDEEAEEESGYPMQNAFLEMFNQQLKDGLDPSIIILDGYSYFNEMGYETEDGLHFTKETNEMLYSFIISNLR